MFYNEKAVLSTIFQGHTKMTGSLFIAGILGMFASTYRLFITICMHLYGEAIDGINNFTACFALGMISVWCVLYANFRIDDENWTKRKKIMKNLSLVACIFCLIRTFTTAVYFTLRAQQGNIVTYIYIFTDIAMWIALTVFFYTYWKDKKKHHFSRHDDKHKNTD